MHVWEIPAFPEHHALSMEHMLVVVFVIHIIVLKEIWLVMLVLRIWQKVSSIALTFKS